jgi:hypothetical protein
MGTLSYLQAFAEPTSFGKHAVSTHQDLIPNGMVHPYHPWRQDRSQGCRLHARAQLRPVGLHGEELAGDEA